MMAWSDDWMLAERSVEPKWDDATRMFFLITAARILVCRKNILEHWGIEKTGRAKYYS